MAKGFLCLLLHAHLPYVRHPEYEDFLEEDWFFEALTESYIPLIDVFDNLLLEGIPFRITISLSPSLICMLEDPLLQRRYLKHLSERLELAEKEVVRTQSQPPFHRLALFYRSFFLKALNIFEKRYNLRLISAFKKYSDSGVAEIITTSATHAIMPLLKIEQSAVKAQIITAVQYFKHVFGRTPLGMWLPECAYYPGLEVFLQEAGINFFFTESHGITNAMPEPPYGTFAPIMCPNGVAVFGRDPESSRQVWSSAAGYPGDPYYREFYRDVGFDLDFDYIKPYIHDGRIRVNTGIKYYRITGASICAKEPYIPEEAAIRAAAHARNFLSSKLRQIDERSSSMDNPPVISAPYDAELFGHWWFEGPIWLDSLIRNIAVQDDIAMSTPLDYLAQYPASVTAVPAGSSWGENGYYGFWLTEENDWIYPHLHQTSRRMKQLVQSFSGTSPHPLTVRALNQAARSLLLAQSSDWAFIMKTGTTVDYAHKKIKDQLARFYYLDDAIFHDRIDPRKLAALEVMDNIFPETINYMNFA
ncbi:MAG: 1,4-alpha-glucan branching protein domain-containing protein [Pseudomonadota bacterium]